MKSEDVMEMCENGDARVMYSAVLVLLSVDRIWISFDGEEWEETDSNL